MFNNQYSILVTGGAGFIGSHVCYFLLKEGFDIISIDSFINSSPKVYNNIRNLLNYENIDTHNSFRLVKGDIKDESLLREVFNKQLMNNKPIKAVVHLAGLKSVNE